MQCIRKAPRYYSQMQMYSLLHSLGGIMFAIQIESHNYKIVFTEQQFDFHLTRCQLLSTLKSSLAGICYVVKWLASET